jgi:uncharacterized protein GlcG (DUF336 family)
VRLRRRRLKENANKIAAALAESKKNNWYMAVAVVDPSETLVYYEKMDNTQTGSPTVAIAEARSAALFKRPTRVFDDAVAGGGAGLRVLAVPGAIPLEGGSRRSVEVAVASTLGSGVSDSSPYEKTVPRRYCLRRSSKRRRASMCRAIFFGSHLRGQRNQR